MEGSTASGGGGILVRITPKEQPVVRQPDVFSFGLYQGHRITGPPSQFLATAVLRCPRLSVQFRVVFNRAAPSPLYTPHWAPGK